MFRYSGRWYLAPVKTQKLLLLLMQKAKEPCGLTAAKVVTASFEAYAAVIILI